MTDVGAQIEQHVAGQHVPASPSVSSAVRRFADAIGGKNTPARTAGRSPEWHLDVAPETAQSPNPDIRTAIDNFWTRIAKTHSRNEGTPLQQMAREALERHHAENIVSPPLTGRPQPTVTKVPGTPDTYSLRDALSQVRALLRPQLRKEIEANGLKVRDLVAARNALSKAVYEHAPALEPLDAQYGMLADELRMVKPVAKAVAQSRRAGPGATEAPLGIYPHMRPTTAALHAAMRLIPNNRAAVADATANMLLRPGPDVASLLSAAPKPARVGPALRAGLLGELPAAMRGLLFPADDPAIGATP